MFQQLDTLPADPILGLNQTFHQDPRTDKINLSVGVYQTNEGTTPIFSAVKKAEKKLFEIENTKAYIAQAGDPKFLRGLNKLIFGDTLASSLGDRIATVMTPGGCGALRMGAEMLVQNKSDFTVWVSNPTWANHFPLLESAGLTLKTYDYYDFETGRVNFQNMLDSLSQIPEGDVVLLHACCHNPSGADINHEQWDQVIALLKERNLLPFFDIAYQGFGDSLDDDAYGIRKACEELEEVMVASSCSKNFGLYRERTGAITIIAADAKQSNAARSHVLSAARKSYSMSPYHGGGIVGLVLSDNDLRAEWQDELVTVCARMNSLRQSLANGLNAAQSVKDFSFVGDSKGMFCFLGITEEQVLQLRSEYGIYLLNSTRINIAGVSEANIDVIVDRVAKVIA